MPAPGTTPGRTTVVTIDAPIRVIQEPQFAFEYSLQEISRAGNDHDLRTTFVPDIGWELVSYQSMLDLEHETGAADGAVWTPSNGTAVVAPGFQETPMQRWYSELSGVPQNTQRTSGDLWLRKQVGAGQSWNTSVSDSFPLCDQAHDTVPCDRVFLQTGGSYESQSQIQFSFSGDQTDLATLGRFAKCYFSSLAGTTFGDIANNENGTGQYCLILIGSTRAELWEYMANYSGGALVYYWGHLGLDGNRHPRTTFALKGGQNVKKMSVLIRSDAYTDTQGNAQGTQIQFAFGFAHNDSANLIDAVADLAVATMYGAGLQVYKVPRATINPTTIQPIRIDLRRDVRMFMQTRQTKFLPVGTLRTVTFKIPVPPADTGTPINFQWYGLFPAGTTLTVNLYRTTPTGDTPLSPVGGSYQDGFKGAQSFTPIAGATEYYATFTLGADSTGFLSPVIRSVRFVRPAVYGAPSIATPWVPAEVEAISITGQDSDPSHATGSLIIHDRTGAADALKIRAGQPIRIEQIIDNAGHTMTIDTGYIAQARRKKKGAVGRKSGIGGVSTVLYPDGDWGTYGVKYFGEWQRLMEAKSHPGSLDLGNDPNFPGGGAGPYKVTDHVRALLLNAGYAPSSVFVPDLAIRYITDSGPLWIEDFTQIGPEVLKLVRDYLGGYLCWRPNSTNGGGSTDKYGCWEVKIPPQPNSMGKYVNFASFHSSPTASVFASAISPASYPDSTDPVDSGQTLKNTFMRKFSLDTYVIPPEFNCLYVTGVGVNGVGNPLDKSQAPVCYGQVARNFKSALFDSHQGSGGYPPAPDPTSPDYLGRIVEGYYSDAGLNSQPACDLITRRLYDMTCHAQKRVCFEAPLVGVTDHNDPLQIRPRPLMYGDPVLVDGSQFFVASCNPDWEFKKGGSRFTHAYYEVFSVPELTTKSPAVGRD